MAGIAPVTPEMEAEYQTWLEGRPANVREVAQRFRPWLLYRMGSDSVVLQSFGEADDGSVTLTVTVTGQYNRTIFDREVFGVPPDDLVECDLPGEDEPLGTLLTEESEIEAYVDSIRPDVMAQRNRDSN